MKFMNYITAVLLLRLLNTELLYQKNNQLIQQKINAV